MTGVLSVPMRRGGSGSQQSPVQHEVSVTGPLDHGYNFADPTGLSSSDACQTALPIGCTGW